jgi:hypothetical protein
MRGAMGGVLFIAVIMILMLSWRGIELLADWFWFQEVGRQVIFSVTFLTQMKVAALFGGAFFVIFYLNLFLAARLSSRGYWVDPDNLIQIPPWEAGLKPFGVLLLLGSLIFALFAALRGSAQWEIFLRYLNGTPFGTQDPLFGRDISFYVFQLPFLKYLYSWLMTVLVLTTLATGGVYFMRRSFQFIPPQTVRVSPPARKHLTFLVAFLFFLGTLGAWIALNEVLYSKRGVVFGPGYTDVNTQVGMFKLLMGATVFCGITILAFAFRRDWRIPAAGLAVFFAVLVVGTGIYPSLVQKLKVTPNEIALEKP